MTSSKAGPIPVPQGNAPQRYTMDEWKREGARRFGPNQLRWRFICPVCGHVASVEDWKKAGAKSGSVAFACVGRWTGAGSARKGKPGPCNYTGGGLFRLNPVTITDYPIAAGEDPATFFAFADPPAAMVTFTVYRSPADYPGEFVVRKWIVPHDHGALEPEPGGIVARAPDLGAVREQLRQIDPGLYRLDRQPQDDPTIVETWV